MIEFKTVRVPAAAYARLQGLQGRLRAAPPHGALGDLPEAHAALAGGFPRGGIAALAFAWLEAALPPEPAAEPAPSEPPAPTGVRRTRRRVP